MRAREKLILKGKFMSFEKRMDELKKPRELGDFGTEETRDLDHAIEILNELRQEVAGRSMVSWTKLQKAKDHLESLMKKHLEDSEPGSK